MRQCRVERTQLKSLFMTDDIDIGRLDCSSPSNISIATVNMAMELWAKNKNMHQFGVAHGISNPFQEQ